VLPFALEFVVGCFIRVLKAPPTADVVNKNRGEIGCSAIHGSKQLLKGFSALDA
jgi:hypothetical protein